MLDHLDLAKHLWKQDLLSLYGKEEGNKYMPYVYQFGVEGGRPYQDDHKIKGVPGFLQPWSWIMRMRNSYRKPMPSYKIEGNRDPSWTPYQEGYPLAPGTEIRMIDWYDGKQTVSIPHILTMHPSHDPGGWSVQGYWDEKEKRIIPCYYTFSTKVIQSGPLKGRYYYGNQGLKPDVNAKPELRGTGKNGDCMWNWPEASRTLKRHTP